MDLECCKDGGGILDTIDAGGEDGGGMSWPSNGGAQGSRLADGEVAGG
jgi:hypothetical protein